jgi:hypothetical protein
MYTYGFLQALKQRVDGNKEYAKLARRAHEEYAKERWGLLIDNDREWVSMCVCVCMYVYGGYAFRHLLMRNMQRNDGDSDREWMSMCVYMCVCMYALMCAHEEYAKETWGLLMDNDREWMSMCIYMCVYVCMYMDDMH